MENNNQPLIDNQSTGPANQPVSSVSPPGSVYVSGEQPYVSQQDLFPKAKSKRLLWASVFLGVLLVVGLALFFWINTTGAKKSDTKNTFTTSTRKVAAPLVTTNAPAMLGPGTYTVGANKNIVPGLYSLSPGLQQSGKFTIIGSTANYSVTLDDNATGAALDTKVAWAQLATGDKVQISGGNLLNVNFRAIVTSAAMPQALAKLYDDIFTVTDAPHRTNPGKYFITDPNDQNAYILVVDKNYTIKYNQPLNSTGFHADLEDGDQIATINMTSYLMKPE
jgi:hypothetical protein